MTYSLFWRCVEYIAITVAVALLTISRDRATWPTPLLPRHRALKPARRSTGTKINWTAATSITTALTAIGALFFTGLSLSAARDQVAITEQGQLTDRYSRAIEQLGEQGSERLQVRLGGIYALERLARDSPRDQPTIIEVLTTFVRSNVAHATIQRSGKYGLGIKCPDHAWTPPISDVQAALTVIGRRDQADDNGTDVALTQVCLTRVVLRHATFGGADLHDTVFSAADLTGADLHDANLRNADLRSANLRGANLRGADLSDVDLGDADLRGADLTDARLDATNLEHADLRGARLTGVEHDERTNVARAVTDARTTGTWW